MQPLTSSGKQSHLDNALRVGGDEMSVRRQQLAAILFNRSCKDDGVNG
jgi:hypothetical protein